MGCCEKINNIFGNDNENLTEFLYLKGIKETNFENEKKTDLINIDNNVMNSLLKSNKFTKIQLDDYKKFKILDKINEVDSEYKESSLNTRLISKEIISPQNNAKIINNFKKIQKDNEKLKKIKHLRKTRSQPEFKTILNEDIFYKKLNEYNENNKFHNKINKDYNISSDLNKLERSKTELKFNLEYDRPMEDFNNKDNTFSFSKKY